MLTNIDIDESLVGLAMELTGETTKRAVVHRALEELVRMERLRALRGARGTLRWRGNLSLMRERADAPYGNDPKPPRRSSQKAHGASRRHKRSD